MSKQLEYINSEIKRLEYRIANPIEYNLTHTIKVRIDDSACYEDELKILNNIKQALTTKSKKEKAFDIFVAKPNSTYNAIIYIIKYKKRPEMLEYNRYLTSFAFILEKEEFNLLKELLLNNN
jgi:hypothetical protein